MSPMLIKAIIAITLALICYTLGVWWEHREKALRPVHLVFFWLGLCMDTTGTALMSRLSTGTGGVMMSVHGITGTIAIVLMSIHAIWATAVLIRKDEKSIGTFHRFSIIVWCIWLIPFILGMVMGMK